MVTKFETVSFSGRDKLFIKLQQLLSDGRIGIFNIILEDGTSVIRPKISSFQSNVIRGYIENPWRSMDNLSITLDKITFDTDTEKEFDAKNITFTVEKPYGSFEPWMITLLQVGEIYCERKKEAEYDPTKIPTNGLIFRYYKTWTHTNAGKSYRVKKVELLDIEELFDPLAEAKQFAVKSDKPNFEKIQMIIKNQDARFYATFDSFMSHTHSNLMKIFVKCDAKEQDYKCMIEAHTQYTQLHILLERIYNKYKYKDTLDEHNVNAFIVEWLRLIKKYVGGKLQLQYLS